MSQRKAKLIRKIMRLQQADEAVRTFPLPPTRKGRKALAAALIARVLQK